MSMSRNKENKTELSNLASFNFKVRHDYLTIMLSLAISELSVAT